MTKLNIETLMLLMVTLRCYNFYTFLDPCHSNFFDRFLVFQDFHLDAQFLVFLRKINHDEVLVLFRKRELTDWCSLKSQYDASALCKGAPLGAFIKKIEKQ